MRLSARRQPLHVPDLLIQEFGAVALSIELALRGGERSLDERVHRRAVDPSDPCALDRRRGRRRDDAVDVAQSAHLISSGTSMTTRRFWPTAAPALSSVDARAMAL